MIRAVEGWRSADSQRANEDVVKSGEEGGAPFTMAANDLAA